MSETKDLTVVNEHVVGVWWGKEGKMQTTEFGRAAMLNRHVAIGD
jgi:hypothetical protein